jgi:hypothetical protein
LFSKRVTPIPSPGVTKQKREKSKRDPRKQLENERKPPVDRARKARDGQREETFVPQQNLCTGHHSDESIKGDGRVVGSGEMAFLSSLPE